MHLWWVEYLNKGVGVGWKEYTNRSKSILKIPAAPQAVEAVVYLKFEKYGKRNFNKKERGGIKN